MGMLGEFVRALAIAGTLVGALAFLLAWWGLRQGYFHDTDSVEGLGKELTALSKKKGKERVRSNPVHEKWMKFGGGFYGVVALLTYIRVEASEVLELFGGLADLVLRFDLGIIISFLVDSFKNFITAIAWPAYWISQLHSSQPWLWFLAAYAGYWGGVQLAQRLRSRQVKDEL
jgi:hypothetical protein